MQQLWQDLRYAARMLRKNAGLTAVIVLSLGIGIGANTAIFSVVNALLLRPLPYPQPERLAVIWLHSPGIGIFQDWPSPGQYIDIRTQNRSFEEMALSQGRTVTLTGRDQPERVDLLATTSSLFHMLGAKALFGRLLLPEEDKPGKPNVAILSHAVWKRLFNSDPQIIGRSITLNGNAYTVAGVLRPDFSLNHEVMQTVGGTDRSDIFVPLPLGADAVNRRGDENYNITVRLKPGVSVRQAQADIDIIAGRIREKDKRDRTYGMTVMPLLTQVVGNVRRALWVLLGAVALVLLIACANVANLLLTRAAGRQKEVAIRTALGARWQRLVRQLLTESLLLALMGGAAGLLIARWSISVLRAINPGNIPRLEEIGIDAGVLAFTFGISIVTGILFGLAPALRAARVDLNNTLKAGGRSSQGDAGFHLARHRLRGLLVVSELAFSLMLLIGAGLLIRSFTRLAAVHPGFHSDHVLTLRIAATGPKYRDDKNVAQFYRDLGERIAHLPGVRMEGRVTALPLTASVGWGSIRVEGFTPQPGQELQVDLRIASADYFRTMEIPLVKGRFFSDHDSPDSQAVAAVDERFAQRFWPHDNPIGKHVWFNPKKPYTVVGVVGSVKQYGLDVSDRIVVYFADQQQPANGVYLVARTAGDPAALSGAIVREVRAADHDVPVYDIRTMESRLYDSVARQRFATTMLGAFALFALILAAVGVYGVMSYLVTQSTHDIGVRVALGAPPGSIVRLVVQQGMALAAAGIGAGLIGAAGLTRVMASLLFGVSATDLATFAAVAVTLAAVAMLATFIPARRATRVDPLVALREE